MEENNKHVQPNSKEEGVQRLNRILSESLIKATDTKTGICNQLLLNSL